MPINNRRYRSSRAIPDPTKIIPQGPVLDYMNDLVKCIYDLEIDIPFLPVNKEPFDIQTTNNNNYLITDASTLADIRSLLGTLLTKLRDAGIIT